MRSELNDRQLLFALFLWMYRQRSLDDFYTEENLKTRSSAEITSSQIINILYPGLLNQTESLSVSCSSVCVDKQPN